MSTSATIMKVERGGKVRAIYVHWDGYPDGVGATLKKHYRTAAQVDRLLDLGSLSVLRDFPGDCDAYRNWPSKDPEDWKTEYFSNLAEALENANTDYAYVFTKRHWWQTHLTRKYIPVLREIKT